MSAPKIPLAGVIGITHRAFEITALAPPLAKDIRAVRLLYSHGRKRR